MQRGEGWLQLPAQPPENVVVPAFDSKVLDGKIGYLHLSSFPPAAAKLPDGKTVPEAFAAALDNFDKAGVTAWVLDLRGNGSGCLDAMVPSLHSYCPRGRRI